MQLSELAAKPQLIQIKLSNKELTKTYGEEIEFYTWDRQPLDVFMRLAGVQESADAGLIIDLIKDLILDEKGKPIIKDGVMLPTDVLVVAVGAIVERLGKL